jgi:hypothetical protein
MVILDKIPYHSSLLNSKEELVPVLTNGLINLSNKAILVEFGGISSSHIHLSIELGT